MWGLQQYCFVQLMLSAVFYFIFLQHSARSCIKWKYNYTIVVIYIINIYKRVLSYFYIDLVKYVIRNSLVLGWFIHLTSNIDCIFHFLFNTSVAKSTFLPKVTFCILEGQPRGTQQWVMWHVHYSLYTAFNIASTHDKK